MVDISVTFKTKGKAKVVADLKSVKKAAQDTKRAFESLSAAARKSLIGKQTTAQFKNLSSQLRSVGQDAKTSESDFKRYRNVMSNSARATAQLTAAQKRLENTLRRLANSINRTKSSTQSLGDKVSRTSSKMDRLGAASKRTTTKLDGLVRAVRVAEGPLGKVAGRLTSFIQILKVGGGRLAGFRIALALLSITVGLLVKSMLSLEAALIPFRSRFIALTGSVKDAKKELFFVFGLAKEFGVSFRSAADGFSRFAAAAHNTGLSMKEIRRSFRGTVIAASALALTADELTGILLAFQQMLSKGKVTAEEFTKQFGNRFPGALNAAATAFRLTTSEFLKLMNAGVIPATEFVVKLGDMFTKTFSKAAETDNMIKAWNNLNTTFEGIKLNLLEITGLARLATILLNFGSDVLESIERGVLNIVFAFRMLVVIIKNLGILAKNFSNEFLLGLKLIGSDLESLGKNLLAIFKTIFDNIDLAFDKTINNIKKGLNKISPVEMFEIEDLSKREFKGLPKFSASVETPTPLKPIPFLPLPKRSDLKIFAEQARISNELLKLEKEKASATEKTSIFHKQTLTFLEAMRTPLQIFTDGMEKLNKFRGKGPKLTEAVIRAEKKLKAAFEASDPALRKVLALEQERKALIETTRTPLERHVLLLERMERLTKGGNKATLEAARRAIEASEKNLAGVNNKLEKTGPIIEILSTGFEDLGASMFKAFRSGEDAMESFKSVAFRIVNEIIDKIFELMVIKPVIDFIFGQSTSGGGGTGGLLGSILGNIGSLFAGGTSGGTSGASTMPTTPLTGSFGMAHGGPVSEGVAYTIGERGAERFIPATDGTIISNDVLKKELFKANTIEAFKNVVSSIKIDSIEKVIDFASGPSFAHGGKVSRGVAYTIGERGAERFIPTTDGTIISNDNLKGRSDGGDLYNIDARGADKEGIRRLENLVRSLNGSIEQRAYATIKSNDKRRLRRG